MALLQTFGVFAEGAGAFEFAGGSAVPTELEKHISKVLCKGLQCVGHELLPSRWVRCGRRPGMPVVAALPAARQSTARAALFLDCTRCGRARTGLLRLPHATVETPAFMPVGTYGAVKGVSWDLLESWDARIVLANTYHLWLRPGAERIAALGGLHRFTGWNRAILLSTS